MNVGIEAASAIAMPLGSHALDKPRRRWIILLYLVT